VDEPETTFTMAFSYRTSEDESPRTTTRDLPREVWQGITTYKTYPVLLDAMVVAVRVLGGLQCVYDTAKIVGF